MATLIRALAIASSIAFTNALTIAEINGAKFLSPYNSQTIANVSGTITAKGPDGLWLRSNVPDRDERTSESIYVFGRAFGANLTVGDSIVIGGRVTEYRSNKDYIYLTEIDRPTLARKVSSGNEVEALVIGKDTRDPPNEQYSSLDGGDVFAVPNNQSLISVANPTLEPRKYGLDFWESLSGELVTVKKPVALTKPNQFGDTWVAGNWKVTGENDRDGLTITDKDANPEAIVIGTPLDGTKNPTDTKMGDDVAEITGVVTYAFGFYRILPTTAIKVTKSQKPVLPKPTKLESNGKCDGITVGDYNVENLAANSSHHPQLADHIVNYMKSPDIVFVQEIQDDNGPTNDAGKFPEGVHDIYAYDGEVDSCHQRPPFSRYAAPCLFLLN
jgi:predicted extracellular nuclease